MQNQTESKKRGTKSKGKLTKGADCHADKTYPDHSSQLTRLSRIRGQIEGIERMIGEQRYCVDILIQFRASMAALRAVELNIFDSHIRHCVASALKSKDEKVIETKIQELTELLGRRSVI